jgi:Permuted papain-like amidase enzyme, YaeF/YiiX, C92 family
VTFRQSFSVGLIIFFLTACSSEKGLYGKDNFSASAGSLQFSSSDPEIVERKILALISFADQSYEWRRRAVSIFPAIDSYQDSHGGRILSKDLMAMHALATRYVRQIRRPLIQFLNSPYIHMDLKNEIQIQTERGTYVERQVTWYHDNAGRVSRNKRDLEEGDIHQEFKADVYHLNPRDPLGQAFLKEFKVSLAASLLLLDNFAIGLKPYLNNKILRRSLLYDTPDSQWYIRKNIKHIWLNYEKYHQSSKLIHAVEIYHKIPKPTEGTEGEDFSLDPLTQELDTMIEESLTYRELKRNPGGKGLLQRIYDKARTVARRPRDKWFRIRFHTTRLLSKGFGNSTAAVKFRDGKLKHLSRVEHDDLISQMKPLDILLEKTPFRLTDKFIPGYYGHIGIWIGTERELREAGVWNELPHYYKMAQERYSYEGPPFQETIRQGGHIVEALRSGVEINTLRHFLNIDDLVVLRVTECPKGSPRSRICLTSRQKHESLLEVFKQIGKNYDFNFNVNTETEIVCSELAYRTFFDIDFQTTKIMGKHSISPEQVLLRGDSEDDPFYPVMMYFNGKRVPGDSDFLRRLLRFLVNEDAGAVENAIQTHAGLN